MARTISIIGEDADRRSPGEKQVQMKWGQATAWLHLMSDFSMTRMLGFTLLGHRLRIQPLAANSAILIRDGEFVEPKPLLDVLTLPSGLKRIIVEGRRRGRLTIDPIGTDEDYGLKVFTQDGSLVITQRGSNAITLGILRQKSRATCGNDGC